MAFISGASTISYTDLYSSFTEVPSGLTIGAYTEGPQGKWYRLVGAGASNLVTANVIQSAVTNDAQFQNMSVLAAAITTGGLQTVTVTNGTTTVAANDFLGGSVSVLVAPDLGSEYTILGHTTGGSGATLTLTLDRPLRTAWTTSTKINMKKNPWGAVIQAPATLTGTVVGVAMFALTAASYGFIQTHGTSAVLADAVAIAQGNAMAPSASNAGRATTHPFSGAGPLTIGQASYTGTPTAGNAIPLILSID